MDLFQGTDRVKIALPKKGRRSRAVRELRFKTFLGFRSGRGNTIYD